MTTSMHITGKCHCGAISFTATIDPKQVVACHCTDCQALSGAPFRAVVRTPVELVVMAGKAKHYVKVAQSGNRRAQGFCSECGTQMYATEADGPPRMLNLRLGCIDQREQLAPAVQVWGRSAMPWIKTLGSIPLHSEGATSPLIKP